MQKLPIKDVKRALILSIAFYICTLAVGLFVSIFVEPALTGSPLFRQINWIISVAISLGFIIPFTRWYLESPKVKNRSREALYFGALIIISSFVLDLLIAIPLIRANSFALFLFYYLNVEYFSFIAITLLTTGYLGRTSQK